MNAGLKRRLRKLEEQYGAGGHTQEKVRERMRRAVLTTLSAAELEALEAYVLLQDQDRHAEPNAAQKAVLDLYEQRYRELETTGTLVVNEERRICLWSSGEPAAITPANQPARPQI